MIRSVFVAVFAACFLSGAATAQSPATTPPSMTELTASPRLGQIAVSPSGRYLALVRHNGKKDFIAVIDLVARKQTAIQIPVGDGFEEITLTALVWKSDERLVLTCRGLSVRMVGSTRMVAWLDPVVMSINRDGSALTSLVAGAVIDALVDDPAHVIVQGRDDDSVGRWLKAIKVDVASGEKEILDRGTGQTWGWVADRQGRLILRYEEVGQASGLQVLGREGTNGWKRLFVIRPRDIRAMPDVAIVAASSDPGKFYVAVQPEEGSGSDTRELRLYDIVKGTMGPRIWSHERYDFDSVIFNREGTVSGFCFWADVYRCDLSDVVMRRDYQALETFFGPDRSIILASSSRDGDVRVVRVRGPDEPGSVYVFDRRTGKVELLGAQWPALHPDRLGPMSRYGWTARDGFALSGYLTEPPARASGPLPLVVMPHGGPEARDHFDYDSWAQAFATRGYMVFQPNFRGSGEFGTKFAASGYGQWGLRMQDDVLDGVQALIDAGKVDPNRVCVVGASYGGYVSQYAGAKRPDRFRCVVSFAGVSDLVAMQRWERTRRGADSPVYRYWLKSIGDPDKDRDRLVATSPITYSATYQPPLLLIHGADDSIVPIAQSRAMEAAMKKAGRNVRLITVEGEGHSTWEPENETMALREMLAFVDKAIGAGAQTRP